MIKKIILLSLLSIPSLSAVDLKHELENKAWEQIKARFSGEEVEKRDKKGNLTSVSIKTLKSNPKRGTFSLDLDANGHVKKVNANQADFKNDEYKLFLAFKKLQNLALWHNGKYSLEAKLFPDYDGSGVGVLKELPQLKQISLAGGSLNDEGLKALGELPHLEYLGIWHIHAGNDGFRYLAESKSLKTLRIGPNWISKQTPELLKDLINCKTLTSLKFGETYHTYEGLKEYLEVSKLKSLDLDNAIFNENDYQKLKSDFPKTKITWKGKDAAAKRFKGSKWMWKYAEAWMPKEVLATLLMK